MPFESIASLASARFFRKSFGQERERIGNWRRNRWPSLRYVQQSATHALQSCMDGFH
jgi:hypothetical protein